MRSPLSRSILSRLSSLVVAAVATAIANGQAVPPELPRWVDSIEVTRPVIGGIGAVTLRGTWFDTCAPDAISHSLTGNRLHLEVAQPGLGVGCGDALTPWSLTEEFGPGTEPSFAVYGSLVSVNPANRSERELQFGPDLLSRIDPPRRSDFQGLGNDLNGTYLSRAADVSADGRVVTGSMVLAPNVSAFITSEAFAWAPETGRFSLGILPGGIPGGSLAHGISADGNTIVGQSTSNSISGQDSFYWTLGSGTQPMKSVTDVASSIATAASRDGQVIVGWERPLTPGAPGSPRSIAYRWTDGNGPTDLGRLYEPGYAMSTDVSANGEIVVGNSGPGSRLDPPVRTDFEPFRWTEQTGMVGLGHLPFDPFPNIDADFVFATDANAISANGRAIVGSSTVALPGDILCDSSSPECGSATRAYRWTAGSGMINLGTVDIEGAVTWAYNAVDTSQNGEVVVGTLSAFSPDGTTPSSRDVSFIWDQDRGMRLLEDVLTMEYGVNLEGWELGSVAAISDDGSTIVGTGRNSNGQHEAWRVVLGRDFVAGDTDFDGDVDGDDLLRIRSNVGLGNEGEAVFWASGDFDGDGVVTDIDLTIAQANSNGPPGLVGDANLDGIVDSTDLGLLLNSFPGSGIFAWSDGDFNGDQTVNSTDLGLLLNNFGEESSPAALSVAVPEPSQSWTILVLTAIALAAIRRREKRDQAMFNTSPTRKF